MTDTNSMFQGSSGALGWTGVGVQAATGIMQGILGYQNYRLAKKTLAQQKDIANINLAQQTDAYNMHRVNKAVQAGRYGSVEEARLAMGETGRLLNTRQLGDARNPIQEREQQILSDRRAVEQQQAAIAAQQQQATQAANTLGNIPTPQNTNAGILSGSGVNAQYNTNKEDELKKNRL